MRAKQHLLCGAAVMLLALPAHAQDVQARVQPAAAASDVAFQANGQPIGVAEAGEARQGGMADTVVTARRRTESAQTVPIAVSVATAESLEHQVINAFQLVNLTPSLQMQSANQQVGAVNFTMRGIGTSVFGSQVESSVGVVIDDVAMSRPQFWPRADARTPWAWPEIPPGEASPSRRRSRSGIRDPQCPVRSS